jgi:hypothetical protein
VSILKVVGNGWLSAIACSNLLLLPGCFHASLFVTLHVHAAAGAVVLLRSSTHRNQAAAH